MANFPHLHLDLAMPLDANSSHDSFIRSLGKSLVQCVLCDTSMHLSKVLTHCRQRRHSLRVRAILLLQQNDCVRQCVSLESRSNQLGSETWKFQVHSALYRVLLYRLGGWGSSRNLGNVAEIMVCLFERKERIALLEQAVWKTRCLVNVPVDFLAWKDWYDYGWKASKAEMYNANEIGIVIRRVSPFLHRTIGKKELPLIPDWDDLENVTRVDDYV